MFAFDRWQHSFAVVMPVKYEYNLKDLADNIEK